MNGIVHLVCNGQQEIWLDAENIEKVEKTFFDYKYNGSVAIVTYKDGHQDYYPGIVWVIIEHERGMCEKVEPDIEGLTKVIQEENDMIKAEEYNEENHQSVYDWDKDRIINTLQQCNGNRKKAAAMLEVSERTLYRRMKQYGIE